MPSGRLVAKDEPVTLVIPGRNCAATIEACLRAAMPFKTGGAISEIVFVDDASSDDTRAIASRFDVTILDGPGKGAAAARNVGWRNAQTPWVWFVDSDCVIEPDALSKLLPHLTDEHVGAVGGSYNNLRPDALLACLIHEEIVTRHESMPLRVDFLGGFNVIYRRTVLEAVGGLDERYPGATAEDADLAFRVRHAGYELRFEPASRVGHDHETRLIRYLSAQRRHGMWRVRLHLRHRGEAFRNAYSGTLDHLQPALALVVLVATPVALVAGFRWSALLPAALLAVMQLPMTLALVRRTGSARYLWFAPLGFLRSFWRGVGLVQGVLTTALRRA